MSSRRPENRRKTGQPRKGHRTRTSFKPGQTGNAGGRPKLTPEAIEVRDLARKMSPAALRRLEQLGRMMHEPGPAVRANEAILNRAWGHPRQEVDLDVQGHGLGPAIFLPAQVDDEGHGTEGATHRELLNGEFVPLQLPIKDDD